MDRPTKGLWVGIWATVLSGQTLEWEVMLWSLL
jgi:hypothetical protein